MRNFRELEIWKSSRKLVKEIYLITKKLSTEKKYGLTSQINCCAISIPVNIAEGPAKYSQKDFVRFLQISLGSSYELESHLILCSDLGFIQTTIISATLKNIQILQKRIASLIKYNNSKG